MIFDRKRSHVYDSIRIRDQKIKKFLPLTDEDIYILERGTVTVETINRIEEKQSELKSILNGMGYWNTPTENKTWNESMIFFAEDHERLVKNTLHLLNAFYIFDDTPKTLIAEYTYSAWNDLEKLLYDLGRMADVTQSNYRECGVAECGGD